MKHKVITYRLTPYTLLWTSPMLFLLAMIFLFPVLSNQGNETVTTRFLVGGILLAMVAYVLVVGFFTAIGIRVARRQERFDAYRSTLDDSSIAVPLAVPSPSFAAASINQIGTSTGKDIRNRRYLNGIQGPDWTYADYAYDIYAETRYGDYAVSTNYYSVFCMTLPRKVPHILFDSRRSRGRQFRTMFAADQIHNMEGDFSKFFTVYIPYGYTIDAYSFISPEVMWAMREAADYDIEIVGDKLYLFGPMGEPEFVVNEMHAKAMTIYKQLADNLKVYRDERLPYVDGRKGVSPFGARLHESIVRMVFLFLSTLFSFMLLVVPLADSKSAFWTLEAVVVVGMTTLFAYKLYKNHREKQRLKRESYNMTHKTRLRRTAGGIRRSRT